jgi:hypothetical protein
MSGLEMAQDSYMKQTISALLITCAGISLAVAADVPQGGEKWKVTSSMQMGGMSLPGQSTELCKDPAADSIPVKTEKNCEVYDNKRTGNTQTFKMRCTGKDAMEGAGEFTYVGKDHYTGKMQVKTGGETMTMSYEGQKLGSCDGGEMNLKAKDMLVEAKKQQAESDRIQVERCHEMAAQGTSPEMMKTVCKDPKDREVFCSAARTHDKFGQQALIEKSSNGNNKPLSETAAMCGFDVKTERTQLCATAEGNGKIDFITAQCPAEADQLAKAQCAGRKYTAISDKYRTFCAQYASNQENSPAGKVKCLWKGRGLGGLLGP